MNIFISYGHDEHISLALRLRDDLIARGHDVWFDEDRLNPGLDWDYRIEQGLAKLATDRENSAVVLLLTPYSVRRPEGFCLNEIAYAVMRGLNVIPLMVVDCEPPLSICRIQWFDMRTCIPVSEKIEIYNACFPRLLKAVEEKQFDFNGTQSELLRTLQPIEFSADILQLSRDFTGREWVFAEVDNWLANPDGSKVFWITGAPGVGKSAIAAWLREHRREIAAFHFCDAQSEEKRNPVKMVRSIAYQLATQLPAYFDRLAKVLKEKDLHEYKEAGTFFDTLIVQPLTNAFPKPDRTIIVLIDALDEATADRKNEIANVLSTWARKTPDWMRFLITSRRETEIVSALQQYDPYVLDTKREENLADLRAYLQKKLPDITPEQTEEILNRSEGVFLYITHVVKEVLEKKLNLARLDEFPRGLGDIYQQFFQRQFTDITYYEDKIAPLLQVVLAALEPPDTTLLKTVCGIDSSNEFQRLLNRLGSLFPVSGSGNDAIVRPFHRSLSDWLTDDAASGHFYVSISDGHKALADYCMKQYRLGVDRMTGYALRHLPAHLCAAERWDDLLGPAQSPGPLTDLRYIQARCQAGQLYDLMRDYTAALAALPEFCEENERIRQHDEAMRTYNHALHEYAKARGDWLFEKKHDNHTPEPPYPPLPDALAKQSETSIPELTSLRATRLRHFANFVSGHLALLSSRSNDVIPFAWNSADSGPVAEQAEIHVNVLMIPWFRRYPRRHIPPLRPQCLRVLEGHDAQINCVDVTPDGRRAVSGSNDETLRVWDMESGECLRVLEGHNFQIRSVSISPDGQCVISGNSDNTLRTWDMESGKCLHVFEGHRDLVTSVNISPDGRHVISGSDDNTLRVWDMESGKCLRVLEVHRASVRDLSISPDGRRAISRGDSNTLHVWDLERGEYLLSLKGHWASVMSVSVSPDGRHVISGGSDNTLRVWDMETGKCLRVFEGHRDLVTSVNISPDGRHVISGNDDNTLRVWDMETGKCLRVFEGHRGLVSSIGIGPDGRRVLSGSSDKTLRVWDVEGEKRLQTSEGHWDSVMSMSVSPDGRHVISGGSDNTLRVWDMESGECLRVLKGHKGLISSVGVSPDGRYVVSGCSDNTLRVWNLESGQCLRMFEGHRGWVSSIGISPDGQRVISGSDDKTLRMWDMKSGKCLSILKGNRNGILSVSVSSDGRHAVSKNDGQTLRVWEIETGKCLLLLEKHSYEFYNVNFSLDGRRMISVSSNYMNDLCVWDMENGKCIRVLEGHRGCASSADISPDGRHAVSGGNDRTLHVWDLENGEILAIYHANSSVRTVTFSPDGTRIVCGTEDGQVHFLSLVNFPSIGDREAARFTR